MALQESLLLQEAQTGGAGDIKDVVIGRFPHKNLMRINGGGGGGEGFGASGRMWLRYGLTSGSSEIWGRTSIVCLTWSY